MNRSRLGILLSVVIFVAACGTSGPTDSVNGQPTAAPATGTAAPASSPSVGDVTGPGPSDSAGPVTSQPPSSEPPATTPTPAESPSTSAEPSASGASSVADACTGSQANRDFFAAAAAAVDWSVLCGALPEGWFLSTGSYRLANGGKLDVSYSGPAGATLALSEGAFCADASGCVPSGTDAGDAQLGSMAGTLVQLDGGGFAIVVDRGATPSWLLVTSGLDQATTVAFGAALAQVGG